MQDADSIPPCPRCHDTHVVRNGRTQAGSPNFLCHGCGRRFVERPKKGPVPDATRQLVRRLLREWNHVGALWDFIRHYNASLR